MLTVGELKKLLDKVNDDTVVIIDGEIVSGFEVIQGRIHDRLSNHGGYMNDRFSYTEKGRDTAVAFLKYSESSDGKTYLTKV